MTAAAVAVAIARRRIAESLREQHALTQSTTVPLGLHRRLERGPLDRLIRGGVEIPDGEGRYHPDLNALDAPNAKRARLVAAGLAGLTAATGVMILAGLL